MEERKRKTFFSADTAQLEVIQELVRSGRYRSVSEFLREAAEEKLQRLRRESLARQLDQYTSKELGDEDGDLVSHQAFDPDD